MRGETVGWQRATILAAFGNATAMGSLGDAILNQTAAALHAQFHIDPPTVQIERG